MAYRCGLDWGEGEHAVCVLDTADGRVVAQFTVEHTQAGLATLHRRLAALASAGELPVALERPSGVVVDALLAADHPVVPIHPNVVQPAGRAIAPPAARAIAAMLICWPICCAPMAIALARSPSAVMRSRPCASWCAAAAIWSPTGSR